MKKILVFLLTVASLVSVASPVKSDEAAKGIFFADNSSAMPSAASYIQDGLIGHWDGIENADYGIHDDSATLWCSLVGDAFLDIPSDSAFVEDALDLSESRTYAYTRLSNTKFLSMFKDAVDMRTLTAEFVYRMPEYLPSQGSGLNYHCRAIAGPSSNDGWVCVQSKNNIYANGNASGIGHYWAVWSSTDGSIGSHYLAATYTPFEEDSPRAILNLYYDGITRKVTSPCPSTSVADGSVTFSGLKTDFWICGPRYAGATVTQICCIRIYARTLTPEEIAYNYDLDRLRFNLP